ncbi:MAG: hypothetical protein AAGC65_25105 [Mucilaginibacter sp.]|uniref:hypothetical protein n=1 Tax=Mucilaginibacter sp. TaxID=1882438 RepID=UPI0031B269DB
MKFKFKTLLVVLIGVTLLYSACRKEVKMNNGTKSNPDSGSPSKPGSPIDTTGMAVVQIVKNITQTFSGAYGGVNISNGLLLPGFTTLNNSKVSVKGLFNLCSFFPDTVVAYRTNIGDTIKSQTSGLFKFYFSCDTLKKPRINGYPVFSELNGYAAFDSLATTGQLPRGSFVYNIKAFYEAKALQTANASLVENGSNNTLISFGGSVKSFVDTAATKSSLRSSSIHAYYALDEVTVDLTQKGDITGGTVTFGAIGEINSVKWYYTGAMKFLGNHKAAIIINKKTFIIDLVTGKTITV